MGSKLVQLAKQLLSEVNDLDAHMQSHNMAQPTFDVDGPLDFNLQSTSADASRLSAIECAIELHDLLLGPTMILRPVVRFENTSYVTYPDTELPLTAAIVEFKYNATSLQAIHKLDVAAKVPLSGDISYTELASLCGIYEPDLKRILRFAMCYYHAFREPRKGFVSHTAASRAILESQGVRDAMGVMFDECWQAYSKAPNGLPLDL